ncbi:Nucleotidyl transferase AbiEii toxin, Type IV TA system [Duganella sp. CF458]|nr:Nucleotidyl transferase AbiEii toxin, Type IV TA system [Duganella sp. CF458]
MRLAAIRQACQAFIAGPMAEQLNQIAANVMPQDRFQVELDQDDPDGQTLLLWYPPVANDGGDYIRSAVKIEAGAKSALDPHTAATVTPYVNEDLSDIELAVSKVITVKPERTFWDKVMILHGLRQWHDRRGELRQGGQRVSRHYYDVHQLMQANLKDDWQADHALAADCASHARLFFGSADLGLDSAAPGTFTLVPSAAMRDELHRDYAAMAGMIFGAVPSFADVLQSAEQFERIVNAGNSLAST